MSIRQPDWKVLLLGGPSGAGKTIAAKLIGQRFGVSWLEVDDLRLALQRSRVTLPKDTSGYQRGRHTATWLQRSRVTLPKDTAALYFFEETPDVWHLPPEHLCKSLIAVGEVMSPAIEVVVENHVDNSTPIVIEGDGILPSLFARPPVRDRARGGQVRVVFLVEPDEEALLANMRARSRGIAGRTEAEQRAEGRTKWLYGQWLVSEARRYNLPVLEPRPWTTLVERIIAASSAPA